VIVSVGYLCCNACEVHDELVFARGPVENSLCSASYDSVEAVASEHGSDERVA
jgi:hypothetical protein